MVQLDTDSTKFFAIASIFYNYIKSFLLILLTSRGFLSIVPPIFKDFLGSNSWWSANLAQNVLCKKYSVDPIVVNISQERGRATEQRLDLSSGYSCFKLMVQLTTTL